MIGRHVSIVTDEIMQRDYILCEVCGVTPCVPVQRHTPVRSLTLHHVPEILITRCLCL